LFAVHLRERKTTVGAVETVIHIRIDRKTEPADLIETGSRATLYSVVRHMLQEDLQDRVVIYLLE
jgi:hypothetical protein